MGDTKAKKKKSGKPLKILILAAILVLAAVGGIIVSDFIFPDDSSKAEVRTVTVMVSGKDILLNGNRVVTSVELKDYLDTCFEQGGCTVALINDTKTPADLSTYNDVVELLGSYGIKEAPLTLPVAGTEAAFASTDEV